MAFDTFNLAQIYGAADRANAQRDAQQYQQYQIQRQMRDDQRQDAVRGAYKIGPDGQLDRQGTYASLYAVDPMAALELQGKLTTQDAASAKAGQENTKRELEIESERAKIGRDLIASATPETWPAIVAQGNQLGMGWAKNAPAEYNQNWVRSNVTTADQFIKDTQPDMREVDFGGFKQWIDVNPKTNPSIKGTKFDKTLTPEGVESARHNKVSEGISQEQLGVSKGNAAETVRHNKVSEKNASNPAGKAPSGYKFNPDGTLSAIEGGPGDRKLNPTETQGKSSLYATRAAQADKILNDLEGEYSRAGLGASQSAQDLPLGGLGISALANQLTPANAQKADQAQRNFINAILRQESGAAISASEFDNARRQYFPQTGDSDDVVAQKADNRRSAISGLNTMAGPLGTKPQEPDKKPLGTPKPGEVVDGYIFNGGNPADPKSWKKK